SATAPFNVSNGPIIVVTNGGAAASATSFTVSVPAAPTIAGFSPATGAAGSTVIITGTNLVGVTSVSFNGVNASSFFADSPTQLEVTVPSGASTGPITLTNGGGTVVSGTNFTVSTPAAPTVTGFTPDNGAVGTSVSVAGTNFVGIL